MAEKPLSDVCARVDTTNLYAELSRAESEYDAALLQWRTARAAQDAAVLAMRRAVQARDELRMRLSEAQDREARR